MFGVKSLKKAVLGVSLALASLSSFADESFIIKFDPSVTSEEAAALIEQFGLESLNEIKMLNMRTIRLPVSGAAATQLIEQLKNDARVKYIEKDETTNTTGYIPSDPEVESQWQHDNINSFNAWDITRGSSDVVVAVIDSGINSNNLEFAGVRFLQGYDFVNNDNDPLDDHGHGTYVTGLLAANADNGESGVGVDHNTSILPLKVLNASNSGTTSNILRALEYATNEGADIISMSLINSGGSTAYEEGLKAARDAGAIIVACAGNGGEGDADISYPGASPQTIAVGATSTSNTRAGFSGTGAALDIVAPGQSTLTTGLDGGTRFFSGCSAATPVAAGVVSLMKSVKPDLTPEEAQKLLLATSIDQPTENSTDDLVGHDQDYGWGLVNAYKAVKAASKSALPIPGRIEAEFFTGYNELDNKLSGDTVCNINTSPVDAQLTEDNAGRCNIGWVAAGEWLAYDVDVVSAGEYRLTFRFASEPGGDVSIEVDDAEIGSSQVPSGEWQQFADYTFTTQLSAGSHTIKVNFTTGNVNFNYFTAEYLADMPGRIEAEAFTAFSETTSGNSGDDECNTGSVDAQLTDDITGGCNIGWTAAGEWLEYEINAEQDGAYDLSLRLASRPGGSVDVAVDGNPIGSIAVAAGGWQNFDDYVLTTALDEGKHTVRVTFTTGNTNFNYMDVSTGTPGEYTLNAVSNLVIADQTATSATLTWNDNSTNEDGYIIQRKSLFSGEYINAGIITGNTFTETDLSRNGTHEFRVAPYKGDDIGPYVEVAVTFEFYSDPIFPVSVIATSDDGNVAENTLDGDLDTRWSAFGIGESITYDLGANYVVDDIRIAWHKGDQRQASFRITCSTNNSSFYGYEDYEGDISSGNTTGFETYPVECDDDDQRVRYIRITGEGNTSNDWTSIADVQINGAITE